LGNFGKPTGDLGTVERSNEEDAVVKWDDDGRMRLRQRSLKNLAKEVDYDRRREETDARNCAQKPGPGEDWRKLARQASSEENPEKMVALVERLIEAYDAEKRKRCTRGSPVSAVAPIN
jgi:hypothetical protein